MAHGLYEDQRGQQAPQDGQTAAAFASGALRCGLGAPPPAIPGCCANQWKWSIFGTYFKLTEF